MAMEGGRIDKSIVVCRSCGGGIQYSVDVPLSPAIPLGTESVLAFLTISPDCSLEWP